MIHHTYLPPAHNSITDDSSSRMRQAIGWSTARYYRRSDFTNKHWALHNCVRGRLKSHTTHDTFVITVARNRDSDSEDCYILAVFYPFLFPTTDFSTRNVPEPIFAKFCHTTLRVLKYFISYMGVHKCPLKNLRGKKSKKPNFCRFADPKSTLWAPPFPNAGKSGNLKQ